MTLCILQILLLVKKKTKLLFEWFSWSVSPLSSGAWGFCFCKMVGGWRHRLSSLRLLSAQGHICYSCSTLWWKHAEDFHCFKGNTAPLLSKYSCFAPLLLAMKPIQQMKDLRLQKCDQNLYFNHRKLDLDITDSLCLSDDNGGRLLRRTFQSEPDKRSD